MRRFKDWRRGCNGPWPTVKIEAIKRASALYLQTKNYHRRYLEFRRATQPDLDLTRSCHREALLSWLRR